MADKKPTKAQVKQSKALTQAEHDIKQVMLNLRNIRQLSGLTYQADLLEGIAGRLESLNVHKERAENEEDQETEE